MLKSGGGCAFGPNLYISSSWHHFDDLPELPIRWQDARVAALGVHENGRSRKVIVGDDCWIGINVVIAPGVHIGRGCVVGANTVVTKDVLPYSVVAGAPARVLRVRMNFSPPRSLYADRSDHIPYFYSGFRQWGDGVDNLVSALECGGWCADDGAFTIALDAKVGSDICLRLMTANSGTLRHGSQLVKLSRGPSTVEIVAEPSDGGLLMFVWAPTSSKVKSTIIIIAVEQKN